MVPVLTMTEMSFSVLEWQNGDQGQRDWNYFIMMKNFMFPNDPIFVIPNERESGFWIKLQNRMGLSWQVEGEFYARRQELQEARPDQNIDHILMPYVNEFPNVPNEFPNVNAQEFRMPENPMDQMPMDLNQLLAQPIEQDQNPGQNFEDNGRIVNMSADIVPNQNLPIEPPRNESGQNNGIVPIEPIPEAEVLPMIDELLQENEEDQNIELIFIEENDIDRYLN